MIDPKPTTTNPKQPTVNEETDTPETLADIIAEMRADVADGENAFFIRADWLALCDRIEAAAARERAKYERLHECFWNVDSIQNIVRQMLDERDDLRDQNPKASESIGYFAQLLTKAAQSATGNAAAMRAAIVNVASLAANAIDYDGPERDVDAYRWLGRIAQTASAAIAAPPRNCDRFEDADVARDAVKAAFANTMLLDDIQLRAVCDWLFDPAKGGDHA